MTNAPLTPPPSEDDMRHAMTTEQTQQTQAAPVASTSAAPAEPASTQPTEPRLTLYRLQFPSIASLCAERNFREVISRAEETDVNSSEDWDESRFLIIAPLVLAYLTVDELPPAKHALARLPPNLTTHPLNEALFVLLAATWEKNYPKIYSASENLSYIAHQPTFFDLSLGEIVKMMVVVFVDSFRQRTINLLSRAFLSMPMALAQRYLGLTKDDVLSEAQANNWSYDAATDILIPSKVPILSGRASSRTVPASSLGTFNRVADDAAVLEGTI